MRLNTKPLSFFFFSNYILRYRQEVKAVDFDSTIAGSNPAGATTIHIPPKNKKLKLAMCTPFKNHKSIYSSPMNSRLYFVESSLKLLLLQIGLYARFYKKRILHDIPRLFFFRNKNQPYNGSFFALLIFLLEVILWQLF